MLQNEVRSGNDKIRSQRANIKWLYEEHIKLKNLVKDLV